MSQNPIIRRDEVASIPEPSFSENVFQITYAIKDKKTGEWKKAELTEDQKEQFERIVNDLEKSGKEFKSLEEFQHKDVGAEFTISKKGVFKKNDREWVNLTDKKEAEKDRKAVRKRVETVAKQLKMTSEVEIHVKVVKPELYQMLGEEYSSEYHLYTQISALREKLDLSSSKEFLKNHGYSDAEIEELTTKAEQLEKSVGNVLWIINETNEQFAAGNVEGAMNYYSEQMNVFFPEYVRAFEEFIVPQRISEGRLGNEALFKIDFESVDIHGKLFATLNTRAQEVLGEGTIDEGTLDYWTESSSFISEQVGYFSEKLKRSNFNSEIVQTRSEVKNLLATVKDFNEFLTVHERRFFDLLRQAKISELDGEFIFGFFKNALPVVQKMEKGLATVEDLANRGFEKEAMDTYAQLMKETFAEYSQVLVGPSSKVMNFLDKIDKPGKGQDFGPLSQLVTRFRELRGKPPLKGDQKGLKALYASFFSNAFKLSQHYSDSFNLVKEGFPEQESSWKEVMTSFKPIFNNINDDKMAVEENIKHIIGQSHEIEGAILGNKVLSEDMRWKEVLKASGWNAQDIQKLSRINDAFAKEIEPLYRGMIAVENESNPIRKRELRDQLTKLAKESAPKLNEITQRYTKLQSSHSLKKLENSILLYNNEVKTLLAGKWNEGEKAIDPALLRLTEKQDKGLQALNALEHLREKTEFLNDFFDVQVHLKISLDRKAPEMLLRGNFTSDPEWRGLSQDAGFTSQELANFIPLYAQFVKTFEPLYLAHARLQDDPDNKQLQIALKKAVNSQTDKLNDINQKIRQWGGLERVEKLMETVNVYKTSLQSKLTSANSEERQKAEEFLKDLTIGNFAEILTKSDELIEEISSGVFTTNSWDENYVSKRLLHSSFHKTNKEYKTMWEDALKSKDLSFDSIKNLNSIYDGISHETSGLQKIERASSADPTNQELRVKLRKAALEKEDKIARFLFEFENWGGQQKLKSVQEAVDIYTEKLTDKLRANEAFLVGSPKNKSGFVKENKALENEIRKLKTFRVESKLMSRLGFLSRLYKKFGIIKTPRK